MALPPGISAKTVTIGIASFFDGTIAGGRVTISAPVNVLHTPSNRPLFSSDMTKSFVDGTATFDLCPTDAPGLNRVDWAYKLKVEISGASVQPEVLYFLLPTAGPDVVDLDGLVTVPSSAGIPIAVEALTADTLDPYTAGFLADPTSETRRALNGLSLGGGGATLASVVAPEATGDADVDTAALQAAIDSTPVGAKLFIPAGWYKLNAPLVASDHITIEGESAGTTFGSKTTGSFPQYPAAPYLTGVVFEQTVAGKDGLQLTGSGQMSVLKNIGIHFADGLASTGHGIVATPDQLHDTGHDMGPTGFLWENILIHGHDGDHYGFVLTNMQYGELIHCHTYHGGGWHFIGDGSTENWGNLVFLNPYVVITKPGTAGGYMFTSNGHNPSEKISAGDLNLMVFVRPQCNILDAAEAAATQPSWDEHLGTHWPNAITAIGADFESSGGNPFRPGPNTTFIGHTFAAGRNTQLTAFGDDALTQTKTQGLPGITATAFGNQALRKNTSGVANVAVGGNALGENTTGSGNTAVGNIAAQSVTTASDVTAVGQAALRDNTASSNTAIGSRAMERNTSGQNNLGIGAYALHEAQTASNNTGIGGSALYNATGENNTAIGNQVAAAQTGAWNNTIIGANAGNGDAPVAGSSANVFIGYRSGLLPGGQGELNVAIGAEAKAGGPGGNATAIGYGVTAGGNGSVAIGRDATGNSATATTANAFVLGTTNHKYFMPGLPTTDPHTAGQLWNNGGVLSISAG